ncbi:Glucose-6-phosphate 1-dehydrogenase [Halioglobus japonicus]|nr:Glucose-6-phosphate 1-dehydrogenase [Halioglobus japonicus]
MPSPKACDLLIVGGEGDLALRKLYPALYSLWLSSCLPEDFRIFAVSRRQTPQTEFLAAVRTWFDTSRSAQQYDEQAWQDFTSRLTFHSLDATSGEALARLREESLTDDGRHLVVYLATPPTIFGPVCEAIKLAGLVRPNTRIVVEKPLGEDRESFLEINGQLTAIFEERQVYRIDHYLGKETVQNLLALRFANMFLEPLWNSKYIDNVQITVAESIGVTGRWEFYNGAGAMRDMLQNHLLQLLCLIAMEPPAHLEPTSVRNEKLKVLSCLRPLQEGALRDNVVVGQYVAGTADGKPVPGYCEEEGSEAHSQTETFIAIKAHIDNWRWANVPFYLRTGKRLQTRYSEIVVEFKPVPHSIFPSQRAMDAPNRLIIRLQPDETISLELMNKVAGLDVKIPLRTAALDLSFPEENEPGSTPDAYQRLLLDVIRENPTLFVRSDEVEEAWKWVDQIKALLDDAGKAPEKYTAGSWGPTSAVALIARDDRSWREFS